MAFSVVGLSLTAKYFGISVDRDMWLIGLNCILVINLAIWGPINETFRAKFVLLRAELGEEQMMAKARALMMAAGTIGVILVGAVMLLRYPIASLLAPAYGELQVRALGTMLLIIAPSLMLDQFNNLCISILNAYHSFFAPEISNGIAALANIVAMVVLAPYIGIYALAVSYYVGLVLMSVLVIRELVVRKVPIFQRLFEIRFGDAMPFFNYALPFFVPYFFIQMNLLIEKSIGNVLGDGIVSILDYARKFVDIPVNALTSVLLTILVPILSGHFGKRNKDGFMHDFRQVYQLGFLIIALLIAVFMSSSVEMISIILYRGEHLSMTTISKISQLSVYYAWTAYVNFFYIIFGVALLSTNRGRIYAFWGTAAQLVMIGLNFAFYQTLGPSVFPLSFIVAHTAAAFALFGRFPFPKRDLVVVTLRYSLVLIILVVTVFFMNGRTLGLSHPVWILGFNAALIFLVLVGLLFLFRLEERLVIKSSFVKIQHMLARQQGE